MTPVQGCHMATSRCLCDWPRLRLGGVNILRTGPVLGVGSGCATVAVTGAKAGPLRPLFIRDEMARATSIFLWAIPPVLPAYFGGLSTTLCLPRQGLQTAHAQAVAAVDAYETRLLREYHHAMFCLNWNMALNNSHPKFQALHILKHTC